MNRTQSISELETEIRNFINRPRRQHELLADRATWNTLCSALDVIGDTEVALEVHAKWECRSEDGEKSLCCTDQQSGGSSHPHPLSCEANVLRPSKLQHAVQ